MSSNEVTATCARFSWVKSSCYDVDPATIAQGSLIKSSDQRWSGSLGRASGARVPTARLRPLRRRTCSRTLTYRRRHFLWSMVIPPGQQHM
jgi:hypothetical protein